MLMMSEHFSTLCYVRADLSPLAGSAQSKEGTGGKQYWTIVFSIEIQFGLTEFRARIKWVDHDVSVNRCAFLPFVIDRYAVIETRQIVSTLIKPPYLY